MHIIFLKVIFVFRYTNDGMQYNMAIFATSASCVGFDEQTHICSLTNCRTVCTTPLTTHMAYYRTIPLPPRHRYEHTLNQFERVNCILIYDGLRCCVTKVDE